MGKEEAGWTRASNDDREHTVIALQHHAVAGRLSLEELSDRCARAYRASTLGELASLTADLPAAAPVPAPGPPLRRATSAQLALIVVALAAVLLLGFVLAAASSGAGAFSMC